jgi:hypothetical protein
MKKQRSIQMSLGVVALIGGLAVVVLGPGGLTAQEPERQWVQSGLPGLAVHTVTPDPIDSQVLYATTPLAIHKTTDGGQSWSVLTTQVPNVVAMAVDPQNSAISQHPSKAGARALMAGRPGSIPIKGRPNRPLGGSMAWPLTHLIRRFCTPALPTNLEVTVAFSKARMAQLPGGPSMTFSP